ncbi:MAG: DUF642 domain-containing protein [Bryobacteraceae bacterium]
MRKVLTITLLSLGAPSLFANLISNPGFELSVMGGNFQIVNTGDTFITDWNVSGAALLMLTSSYTENGGTLLFPSHSGDQHLDITGAGNTLLGQISQTVTTTPGIDYTLSFWVGNQDDADPVYPNASLISLYIDGSLVGTYGHSDDTPNQTTWREFVVNFKAASASTTIAFENATPTGDNMAGLDDVSLDVSAANVNAPEPGTFALAGIALLGLAALRRR